MDPYTQAIGAVAGALSGGPSNATGQSDGLFTNQFSSPFVVGRGNTSSNAPSTAAGSGFNWSQLILPAALIGAGLLIVLVLPRGR